MNPKNSEAPVPVSETTPGVQGNLENQQTPEKPATPETALTPKQPSTTTTTPVSTDDLMTQVDESHSNSKTAEVPTTENVVNNVVDEGDLIEKEWVEKAKQIVEKTRDDPHKQSEELNVFKADYMKQRYNKNIKVDT